MPAGSTTGSNYTKTARLAMSDAGIINTSDHYVSLVRWYYSGPLTTQTTKPNRLGTTVCGLASALSPTNTSWAPPRVYTVLGQSVDCRSPTDTTAHYSTRSLPLPGKPMALARSLLPLLYYQETLRQSMGASPRRRPLLKRRTRLRIRSRNYLLNALRVERRLHRLLQRLLLSLSGMRPR